MPIDDYRTDSYLELYSGKIYTPNQKRPVQWDVVDIAHSLGNQCRYTGHCRHFYSVAEHSVLCSLLAEELGLCDPFEALMHDAHEAVISDMAAPWKPHLPDYRAAEKQAQYALREHYGLPLDTTAGCHRIDMIALFIEAEFLMKSKGQTWEDPLGVRVDALRLVKRGGWHLTGMDPNQAKGAFLRRFSDVETEPNRFWEAKDGNNVVKDTV